MPRPKVSLVMSVFDERKDFLEKVVDSVLKQTFQDFEFLIIDDGNGLDMAYFLQGLKHPKIKLIHNKKNIGLTKSLNKGLDLACGDYYARIDSDDLALPLRLEKQINFLDRNPQYVLVGGHDESESEARGIGHEELIEILPQRNPFIHSTLMIRKSVLEEMGGYDESFYYAQDYDLIERISHKGRLKILPHFFVKRMVTRNTISFSQGKKQLLYSLKVRLRSLYSRPFHLRNFLLLIKSATRLFIPVAVYNYFKAPKA